jgi:vacuolar-type H+-ATPase subunit H
MPRSRDILTRFRPTGTPGAAAPTGVPSDRVAEATAELEPVIALLADAQQEAAGIRADAEREAERRLREATEYERSLVASAHRQAEAERANASLQATGRAEEDAASTLSTAEREAADIRQRASERMSAYVDAVVSAVRGALHDPEEHRP